MHLPRAFCWSKYGAEAGECATEIVHRKELERRHNDGMFLWGIGTSIRPSLALLLDMYKQPHVVFSPMVSRPRMVDRSPTAVCVWTTAVGFDGFRFKLPEYSLVTSRASTGRRPQRHFALVCASKDSLLEQDRASLFHSQLRNLRTGTPLGHSQVTSVVRYAQNQHAPTRLYRVGFRAKLVYPFLIELMDPMPLPDDIQLNQVDDLDRSRRVQRVLDFKESRSKYDGSDGWRGQSGVLPAVASGGRARTLHKLRRSS